MWQWTGNSEYSAKSFYNMVVTGGKLKWRFNFIWQLQVPPTVRIFTFLCLKGKLLTHDVMLRRGMQCDLGCVLCASCQLETIYHIMFQCDYARRFWSWYSRILGYSIMHTGNSVQLTVTKSWRLCQGRVTRKV